MLVGRFAIARGIVSLADEGLAVVPVLPYAGLFVLSFLAATMLPFGSEAALAGLVGVRGQLVAPVLVATAENVLGFCTTYWLGRKTARTLVRQREQTRKGPSRISRGEVETGGSQSLYC